MKNIFPNRDTDEKPGNTDSEAPSGDMDQQSNPLRVFSPVQLKKLIHKNRKFFRVRAELSINSN